MSRSRIPIVLALFAVGLLAVPTALAKSRDHRAVRIHAVCTQKSTGKLKLSREDGRVEIEFEVDQNQNDVPWTVTLSRNGRQISSFTATTRAPSGSFEIRRVVAGTLGTDRFTAAATRASGETCTADSAANAKTAAKPAANDYYANAANGHDAGDDHGHHSGSHS